MAGCGPSDAPIVYHLLISGFRQKVGQRHGMYILRERLVADYHYCNGHSRVELWPWDADWKAVAQNLWLLQQDARQPLLVGLYAYSWGAGWGAVQLAKRMKQCGLKIRVAVFCDPVFRHPRLFLRWTSLLRRQYVILGWPIIRLPAGAFEEVYVFRQEISRPQGHYLLPTDDETIVHPPQLLPYDHAHIDEAWEFHSLVLSVANRLRKEAGCPTCEAFLQIHSRPADT